MPSPAKHSKCVDILVKYQAFSEQEAKFIVDEISKMADGQEQFLKDRSVPDQIAQFINNKIQSEKKKALEIKQAAIIQQGKIDTFSKAIINTKNPHKLLFKTLIGSIDQTQGSGSGVDQIQRGVARFYESKMFNALESVQPGISAILSDYRNNKAFIDKVADLMHSDTFDDSMEGKVAKIFRGTTVAMVNRLRRGGVMIENVNGYIVKQTHDAEQLLYGGRKAGTSALQRLAGRTKSHAQIALRQLKLKDIQAKSAEEWVNFVEPLLDFEKTFKDLPSTLDKRAWLTNVFNQLASNVPIPNEKLAMEPIENVLFNKLSELSLGDKIKGQHRELHFKSGSAFIEYSQRYGMRGGNILQTMQDMINQTSKTIGLIEKLGPNPDGTFKKIRDIAKANNSNDVNMVNKLNSKRLDAAFDIVSGKHGKGVGILADTLQSFRTLNNVTMLGKAFITSLFSDPIIAMHAHTWKGQSFAQSIFTQTSNMINLLASKQDYDGIRQLGLFTESMAGGAFSIHDHADSARGLSGWINDKYFKLNLLSQQTNYFQKVGAFNISRTLSEIGDKALKGEKLPKWAENTLSVHDLSLDEFKLISKFRETINERNFISQNSVYDIPDQDLAQLMHSKGMKSITQNTIDKYRDELQSKMSAVFANEMDYFTLIPQAGEQIYTTGGASADTAAGQFWRSAMQFKGFTTSFMRRVLARNLYGRSGTGELSISKAITPISQMFVAITAANMIQLLVRDFLSNGTIPQPETKAQWASFVGRAAAYGGGLGFVSDLLFLPYQAQGNNLSGIILGPTVGRIEDLGQEFAKQREYSAQLAFSDTPKEFSLKGFANIAKSYVPAHNLFYTELLFKYAVFNDLNEWVNPGWNQTMQKRKESEGNSYVLPPNPQLWQINQ